MYGSGVDPEQDEPVANHSRPPPVWIRRAERLLQDWSPKVRRVRTGWQILVPLEGEPEARFVYETAASSWFVTYQELEGGVITRSLQVNDPGMTWGDAATLLFALMVQLDKEMADAS